MTRWFWLHLFTVLPLLLTAGCASKSITKSRSEVIKEAEEQGIVMRSIEEDRALLQENELQNSNRLETLIRSRANNESRDPNYRIGAGDEIEISVFDVPELNLTAKVRQSGFVALPLVGSVPGAGLSETEFADELKSRLSTYVRRPEVSVFISNYGSQLVSVVGAVRKPGNYPLKKSANSILELISQAEGISDRAGNYLNFVPAELSGVTETTDPAARARLALDPHATDRLRGKAIEIPMQQVMGTSGAIPIEIPVRGGDMIIVPEAGKVMVEGEVEKSGQYELGQQMTVISALAASGGITYSAKVDEVEVIRELNPGQTARVVFNLEKIATGEAHDIPLKNGDVVRVPSDRGKRMRNDTFESITKIINFGVGGSVNLAK